MNPSLRNITLLSLNVVLLSACALPRLWPTPTPIADRSIHLVGYCKQSEEDGFREQATLIVRNNQVQDLDWQLWVGKKGSCNFKLSQFVQLKHRPHIELVSRENSACKLLIWQEPRRVTLAHSECAQYCSPGIYDEAWPVMFDPQTGQCAPHDKQ